MRSYWFSPKNLSTRLACGGVTNQEIAYLILANLLLFAVVFYGGITWANAPWTWLSLYEFAVFVAVNVVGVSKCYAASGGDSNDRFAVDFSCLSFPIWMWTMTAVWGVYWAVRFVFLYGLVRVSSYENMGLYQTLTSIGGNIEWMWTFIATIGAQVIFFWWLRACLARVARIRHLNQ